MARRLHGKRFKVRLVNHSDDSDDGGGGGSRDARNRASAAVCGLFFENAQRARASSVCVCVSVRTRESSD